MGATLTDEVKDLIGQDGATEFMIHPDVLVLRRPAGSNHWVGQDSVPDFVAYGWLRSESQVAELQPSVLVTMVEMFIDLERVDAEALPALGKLMDSIANANGVKSSDPGYDAFANVQAKVCRLRGDGAGFQAWVRKTAAGFDARWPCRGRS
ncbi:hypothetical protein E0H93_06460 [Rhizobium leguminosarum bv. viciae]|jgi:hypothetical protein|uniref:hypothetical protein n=1 Tax=Rhizobium leguminosarum TaxID=384 RepID=UPI00103DD876|nr:hypothetical protein [Rhizobium leguminosarum]TBY36007.1 hypothetical protein E0H55_11525 [Rhizobium leguminosarum bv. viciae]TCB08535.1 hypothetical protein E0H93_06460 [Rhizobium leguminosarum bv. viciae]